MKKISFFAFVPGLLVIATFLAGIRGELPVDLGLVEPYAVLAGTSVTSTGTTGTVVTGDMGVYPGYTITGFPPSLHYGTLNSFNSAASTAQSALADAYIALAAKTVTTTLPSQNLGGMTLLPGVFNFDASVGIDGILTLNANGDPAAVWIFQIGSTLLPAAGSSVVFANNTGNPNYVYWQVGSSATLGTNSFFVGNILAQTSITVNTGATVVGRCLARNGAITLDNNLISLPVPPASQPSSTSTTVPPRTVVPTEEPTADPTVSPSEEPTANPSTNPSANPSVDPSANPSVHPSAIPSVYPSADPSANPSADPSAHPSANPSVNPSVYPTAIPSAVHSAAPSAFPTVNPSASPSLLPSVVPTVNPSTNPTVNPSASPSFLPSAMPTVNPSAAPSVTPSTAPTMNPSAYPSAAPSVTPSTAPTVDPSANPTANPSASPSVTPSTAPTMNPSAFPSLHPSVAPSKAPTASPSAAPSAIPSAVPTANPSVNPTVNPSAAPSLTPSKTPTATPSVVPSVKPSASLSMKPSPDSSVAASSVPTIKASVSPTVGGTLEAPSVEPTSAPGDVFDEPSVEPSVEPSAAPTKAPATLFSASPSALPSEGHSRSPSQVPTILPSKVPSISATLAPSSHEGETTAAPNVTPTTFPSQFVPHEGSSGAPSAAPTAMSSKFPSQEGSTGAPNAAPSAVPSNKPQSGEGNTGAPSATPSTVPSRSAEVPHSSPSVHPAESSPPQSEATGAPNVAPTIAPSKSASVPSAFPPDSASASPSLMPSVGPSVAPFAPPTRTEQTVAPTAAPLDVPTTSPSVLPSLAPTKVVASVSPSINPSAVPSAAPSVMPSTAPSAVPTANPTVSYPTFTAPIRVLLARTSVGVTVSVSGQGTIDCAALLPGKDPSSVLDIKNAGSQLVVSKEGTYTFDVYGLTPSSEYKLYCYTESFASVPMPLAIAFAYAVQFSTQCCRSIEFSKTNPRIAQYVSTSTRAEQPFVFFLDSKPTSAVAVSVSLNLVSCSETGSIESTLTDAVVQPSTFQFFPNSTSLSGSFLVRGTTLGCYALTVSAAGKAYTSANTRFEMTSSAAAPSVPVLSKVSLSDSGIAVLFTFDSATDRGEQRIAAFASSFSCSLLVSFPGSDSSMCKWLNSSQLSASIPTTAQTQVQVSDTAYVLANILRAACVPSTDCKVYEYMGASSLVVSAPDNALRPVVALSAPNTVSACSDIALDPTLSTGFGGRAWTEVLWVVSGSPIAENSASTIAAYLNANFPNTFSVATVPTSYLTRSTETDDATYTISLKLRNFLQQTAVTSVVVKVNGESSPIIPTISVSGADSNPSRWKSVSLFASVTWPKCASNATRALPIQYDWLLYRGSTLLRTSSSSRDKRFFKLPAYTLDASSTYTVTVTASVKNKGVTTSATASTTLQTGASGVSAVISGAAARSGSALANIVMDASLSKDIDYPPGQSSPAALTYVWSCVVVSPAFGSPCEGFVSKNTPTYTIPAGSLPAQVYSIGVTVANAAGAISSASIELTLVGSALPSLEFTQTKTKYNPEDKVILSATIAATSGNVLARWSSPSIDHLKALTPLSRVFQAGSSYAYQFALAGNSLTAGLTYTFQLSARYTNLQQAAISSVSVVINAPPAGGSLEVTPPTGTALSTQFYFSTTRWTDDAEDLPLVYVLAYYSVKATSQNIVKTRDAISYKTATLGQGLLENNYLVVGIATAFDNLNSSATATSSVTVTPPASADAVLNSTFAALDFALLDSNPSAVQEAVDGALSSVNAVNCTVPTTCSTLNREICSETARTCGPCLTGYIGQIGDANVACLAKADAVRRLATANYTTPKSCPGDCSGQGTCEFTDLYEQPIAICTVSEPSCRARCACAAGFYGKSCSLGWEEYQKLTSLREKLCTSMYATISLQDVTPDVVKARGLSISNILVDINQISDTALGNCTAALVETVIAYPVLSCQGPAAALTSKALSNVLEKGRGLPEDLLESVNTALTALAIGCQSALSVGEDPTVITTNNVNILAAVSDSDALANLTLSAPQTDYDTFNGLIASTVAVDATSVSGFGTVGVTVYQYTNNPNGLVTNSSQISVQTTSEDPSSLPALTLVLQNNEPIDYASSALPSVMAVRCFDYESAPYVRNVTCNNGLVVNLTCPAFSKGTYNVTCPGRVRTPQCKTFDGTSFVVNPLCSVLSFDAYSTTCYCAGSTARRVLQDGSTTATQYGTAFVDIGTNFGTTFASAPSLTDVQENLVILSTLAGIVGMWIVGSFFFLRWDKYDTERAANKMLVESKKTTKVRMAFQFFNSIFPDELRAGSWYVIFMYQMRREHFLIRLFTTNDQDESLRSVFWATAMCKFIAFLFMNCLVASTMYPDDGYCESFLEPGACSDAKSVGGLFNSCKWRTDNESCEFNPPNTDFITSMIITLVVTMLTIPLEFIMEANIKLWAQYFHYTELERKIAIDDTPAEGAQMRKYDEFTRAQGYRATIWRAARLEKARQQIDFVNPEDEAHAVEVYAKEVAAREKKNVFASVLQQISLKKYRYSIDDLSHKAIVKRVEYVREEAETIRREMEVMDSTEEQEKFLMRQFIVNSFATMQRGVLAKYFLKEYSLKRDEYMKMKERASFVFLPLLIAFLIYYVFIFNLSIGSRATNLWLIVTFIGLAQDVFLIAPLKVFINFMVINNNVSRDVRLMCERLSVRSRLILMRTHGMMRDAGSLVQHFNPACRAARMYPALPISRLLMSLNDQDLPHPELPHPSMLPWAYFSLGVVGLLLLPEVLTETILDISIGGITDFGLIGLEYLRRSSVLALVLLIVLIVLAVAVVSVLMNRRAVREMFSNNPEEIQIPTNLPLEDESSTLRRKPGSKAAAKYFQLDNAASEKENLDQETNELFATAGGLEGLHELGGGEQENFGSIWGMKKNKSNRDMGEPAWESNNADANHHNNHHPAPQKGLDMQVPDNRHLKPKPIKTPSDDNLELESFNNSPVAPYRMGLSTKATPALNFADVVEEAPNRSDAPIAHAGEAGRSEGGEEEV